MDVATKQTAQNHRTCVNRVPSSEIHVRPNSDIPSTHYNFPRRFLHSTHAHVLVVDFIKLINMPAASASCANALFVVGRCASGGAVALLIALTLPTNTGAHGAKLRGQTTIYIRAREQTHASGISTSTHTHTQTNTRFAACSNGGYERTSNNFRVFLFCSELCAQLHYVRARANHHYHHHYSSVATGYPGQLRHARNSPAQNWQPFGLVRFFRSVPFRPSGPPRHEYVNMRLAHRRQLINYAITGWFGGGGNGRVKARPHTNTDTHTKNPKHAPSLRAHR